MSKRDLTLEEASEAFRALANEIGPKAEIWPRMECASRYGRTRSAGAILSASVRVDGLLGKTSLPAVGNSWRDLVENCRAVWAEHSDTHTANTIREMALAIISITADQGTCTDAALRATFDAADIASFGERACAAATEMASNGPFSIVRLTGANDQAEAA